MYIVSEEIRFSFSLGETKLLSASEGTVLSREAEGPSPEAFLVASDHCEVQHSVSISNGNLPTENQIAQLLFVFTEEGKLSHRVEPSDSLVQITSS